MRIYWGGSSWLYFLLLSSWRKVSTFMGKQLIHLHFEQWNYPFLFRFWSREGKWRSWVEPRKTHSKSWISPLEFLPSVRTSIRQSTVSHDFFYEIGRIQYSSFKAACEIMELRRPWIYILLISISFDLWCCKLRGKICEIARLLGKVTKSLSAFRLLGREKMTRHCNLVFACGEIFYEVRYEVLTDSMKNLSNNANCSW